MTFLDIVKKVNLHIGLQGSVLTVDATNYQEYLAEAVRSVWIDLQNQREDWKFMWETVTFQTSAGVHEYPNSSILVSTDHGLAKWKTDSIFMDGEKLREISFQEYRDYEDDYNTATNNDVFAVKEYRDAGLIIPNPAGISDIQADYYRTPQVLINNTDVPLLPEEFHYLIVWKAVEEVASYLGNPSIYERHSYKADILENKLMRSQVPSKKVTKKPIYRANNQYPNIHTIRRR